MSDFFEIFKETTKEKFIERNEEFKVLNDPAKIKEIAIECANHQIEQMKLNIHDRWFYTDEYGYQVILVNTFKDSRGWNVPKKPKTSNEKYPNEYEFQAEFPLMYGLREKYATDIKLKGNYIFFFDKIEGNKIKKKEDSELYNKQWLIRGEMYVKYNPLGTKNSYFKTEFLKVMGNYKNINEIDPNDYVIYFTFRIYQILATKERRE